MPQRPTLRVIITYAIGQLGWSLASYAVFNMLVYFYMPPETGATSFPTFIYQGTVLGIFTIIGFLGSGGRILDAITDPLIASWSDRTSSSFGKRKKMMAIAIVPFTILSFLIFMPISMSTTTNTIWLLAIILLFYFFMTMYVVPYTALISELGHHPDDRLLISTIISVTWALGFILGNTIYALQAHFELSMESARAFQTALAIMVAIAFLCMLVPILFLNENKYARQESVAIDMKASLRSVFKNRNFRFFIFSDLMYWLAVTFIQVGVAFYVTVLFAMEKEMATLFSLIGFLASFLIYAPINILAKRWGKKRIVGIAFLTFCIIFLLTGMIGWLPIPSIILFYMLAGLSAIPLAVFGILPNTIIADVIHQHEAKTGEQLSGMFYAARNFMMKVGVTLSTLIFPSLLLLGKSIENDLGIRFTCFIAFFFCLIGYFIFMKYQDVSSESKPDAKLKNG